MTTPPSAQVHRLVAAVSATDWSRGPAHARVTLLEYGDYECADCRAAYPVLESVFEANRSRMRMVFRHFPFESLHPHAMQAALAAEAAGKQGRFWEMHARLYESSGRLTAEDLERYAMDLHLDMDRFRADMADPELARSIRQGKLQAVRSGVGRVPTVFLNDVRYDGSIDFDSLTAAVAELAKE